MKFVSSAEADWSSLTYAYPGTHVPGCHIPPLRG